MGVEGNTCAIYVDTLPDSVESTLRCPAAHDVSTSESRDAWAGPRYVAASETASVEGLSLCVSETTDWGVGEGNGGSEYVQNAARLGVGVWAHAHHCMQT